MEPREGEWDPQGEGECVGLGVVRGVDYSSDRLYLLTPTPLEQLQRVNTLQVVLCFFSFVKDLGRAEPTHAPGAAAAGQHAAGGLLLTVFD